MLEKSKKLSFYLHYIQDGSMVKPKKKGRFGKPALLAFWS
jgi:hypothetical protein